MIPYSVLTLTLTLALTLNPDPNPNLKQAGLEAKLFEMGSDEERG